MIEALMPAKAIPSGWPSWPTRRIKAPPEALCEALRGRVTRHHRFLLRLHLKQIDAVNVAIDDIDQEVDAQIEPFRTAIQPLDHHSGGQRVERLRHSCRNRHDMNRFPTAAHLILLGRPLSEER